MSNTPKIKIIKKKDIIRPPFDAERALMELEIYTLKFAFHLDRCDSKELAEYIGKKLIELGNQFQKKAIALEAEDD